MAKAKAKAKAKKATPRQDEEVLEYEITRNLMATPVPVGERFAMPPAFTVLSTFRDRRLGPLSIDIEVEISDQRAQAKRVSVGTESPRGVSSTTLRAVPIRDIVATGVRDVLMRVELTATGATLHPVGDDIDEEVIATVKRLVGYIDGAGI